MENQETVSMDFFNSVAESAHDLANAFTSKILSDMSFSEHKDEDGTTYKLIEKQLLALAITFDTAINVLHEDLINALTGIAESENPLARTLAISMNGEAMNRFEEKACDFHMKFDQEE